MEKDWVKIMSDASPAAILLMQGKLLEQDIPSVVIDKKDHAYQMFGESELYVHRSHVVMALHALNQPGHGD